jgi:NAD(P)-dependent dehydrogenase (short-subunit alcohol dehydrogenase family)
MRPAQPRKVAIVTGASQGIGAGLAAAFDRAGYAVVATSRSIEPSDDPDVLTVAGDIADADNAERVVESALDRFGRVDTLINDVVDGILYLERATFVAGETLRIDGGQVAGH